MPCRQLTIVALALVAAVSCSHQQEIKQPPKVVARPPAPAPPRRAPTSPAIAASDDFKNKEESPEIYFDFDSALLRDESRSVLQRVAEMLQRHPSSVRIEGNCDEVGTVEYNLALGDERARAAKEYLVHLGVASDKIATTTYGSQRPKDLGHDERAHARNRRDDFLVR